MKILILSAHTIDIENYSKISVENKYEYSKKHGYDFLDITGGFDETRPPAWSKLLFIKQYLDKYDYIFWLDADALIMRFDIKLETFISGNEKYDMIFNYEDWWDKDYNIIEFAKTIFINEKWWNSSAVKFNSGAMFIKNSEFSFKFLDDVYNSYNPNLNLSYWEQGSIWKLYNESEHKYPEIKLLPARTFNSPYSTWCDNKYTYREGDFICHFLASENDYRYNQMNIFVDKVIK